jgi:hypothetical protein
MSHEDATCSFLIRYLAMLRMKYTLDCCDSSTTPNTLKPSDLYTLNG